MNDSHSLLGQLKIDRGPETAEPPARWPWLLAIVLIVVAVIAAQLLTRDRGVPVTLATAAPLASSSGAAASMLDASGYVVARRQATVSAKITGKLQDLYIEEGQKVAEGDVMARLDDSNARASLLQAQANLAAARAAAENIRPIYERDRKQAAAGFISAEALNRSKANYDAQQYALQIAQADVVVAQRNLDDTVVRAPFSGVITTKAAQPGEIVSPISAGGGFTRTGIGTLVDMDSLEVEVDVNENFINRVTPGQAASVKLNAYPDWVIPAEVIAVIPTADRAKATVKVRVGFKLKDARILPEMGARVSFLSERKADDGRAAPRSGVSVPETAVQRENPAATTGVVYVVHGHSVERRAVQLGAAPAEGQLGVLSGLSAGDELAIGDFTKLQDGTKIRIEVPK
ncbi:efflux RND transporter periplasmic adaptor subunit [Solimonas terrae]|uniref:Efflux RND transporter periplasmic adaptor subunit n=1 Tax=Solimonas terrae TaxID=1396819 RepID=A0A6M2BNU3_9GAMM|nr:efflux RND transporter periplasmic adaptor subunit [Solimonas terrae]NGY04302.1 efflux RND transporter periplasmic adaptor subunit [Solimonas terrae]